MSDDRPAVRPRCRNAGDDYCAHGVRLHLAPDVSTQHGQHSNVDEEQLAELRKIRDDIRKLVATEPVAPPDATGPDQADS